MNTLRTAHLNNLIGTEDGDGENGPILTFKGTKANLAKVEAESSARKAGIEAPRCSGTDCDALLETIHSLCWDCLGRKTIDPRLVRLREFKALNRHLSASEPEALGDYTVKSNDSIRYAEQAPIPALLEGITDNFTLVEKERRLDQEWGGSGQNWEGKAEAVFFALGLPYGPDLPGYKHLAGLVAKTSWRVAQSDPNRLDLVGDLESYLWTGLLALAGKGLNWDLVRLSIFSGYKNWYKQLNQLKVLSSDAHGNALSMERRAYAERESDGSEEWLANESDYRTYHWESYVEAQANVDYLLQALPEDIREIVVMKASGVNPTKTQRTRLYYFLKGGPTKRRTTPDGRSTETPENAFQVQMILEGGLPAGRNGIVSWHKPASRK